MAKRLSVVPDRDIARKLLDEMWSAVLADDTESAPDQIASLVNSEQTAIRFCLPTQLLGKLAEPNLDALCLQRGDGADGRWDPRGFATAVIVPWNRANQNVLGRSGDPYVSNPLRRPRVDAGLAQMADKAQWGTLCEVLATVQEAGSRENTRLRLHETLVAIRDRLRALTFTYVIPTRVSLAQACSLVAEFLGEGSGGDRGLCVAAAFFEAIKDRVSNFSTVRRGVINAADTATGATADLECIAADEKTILLAVEVKERQIDESDIETAVLKARQKSVQELLLINYGLVPSKREAALSKLSSSWASGTNVYNVSINEILLNALPLIGETGIRDFVRLIGEQLDSFSTQPRHRQAWKALLDRL